jgi:hypothetical protein
MAGRCKGKIDSNGVRNSALDNAIDVPQGFSKTGSEKMIACRLYKEPVEFIVPYQVKQPGYSDADAIVHFHVANLVYLGEVFPGDGYPEIDPAQGGRPPKPRS